MALFVTDKLASGFEGLGPGLETLTVFGEGFRIWQQQSDEEKLQNPLFGKDLPYDYPLADGDNGLRHVHLKPRQSDMDATRRWQLQFDQRLEKTSDAVLIYCHSVDGHDSLLLYVLPEDAHVIVRRGPVGDRALRGLARIADAWRLRPGALTDWQELAPY